MNKKIDLDEDPLQHGGGTSSHQVYVIALSLILKQLLLSHDGEEVTESQSSVYTEILSVHLSLTIIHTGYTKAICACPTSRRDLTWTTGLERIPENRVQELLTISRAPVE